MRFPYHVKTISRSPVEPQFNGSSNHGLHVAVLLYLRANAKSRRSRLAVAPFVRFYLVHNHTHIHTFRFKCLSYCAISSTSFFRVAADSHQANKWDAAIHTTMSLSYIYNVTPDETLFLVSLCFEPPFFFSFEACYTSKEYIGVFTKCCFTTG
jgi:hypothetical protein